MTNHLALPSVPRVEALRRCLECCEAALEGLIASDKAEDDSYTSLSLFDWLNLIFAFSTLGSLAKPSPPEAMWDPNEMRIVEKFRYFKDAICRRMPTFHGQDNDGHFIERFRQLINNMLGFLEGKHLHPAISQITPETPSHSVELPPLRILGTISTDSLRDFPQKLPSVNPTYDMANATFPWMFLQGKIK